MLNRHAVATALTSVLFEQSANLRLAERAGAVAVYREGLERPSRQLGSLLLQLADTSASKSIVTLMARPFCASRAERRSPGGSSTAEPD